MGRALGLAVALASLTASARADDAVDIISRNLWIRKGGLACTSVEAAVDGGTGFLSNCLRLPTAVRVELVNPPDPATGVYYMRLIGIGDAPRTAWVNRSSLTNVPPPR